jgi:hypothetical protein
MLSEPLGVLEISSSMRMAVEVTDLSDSVKEDAANIDKSNGISTLDEFHTPPAQPGTSAGRTGEAAGVCSIATEAATMTKDGAPDTVNAEINPGETNSGRSILKDVVSEAQPQILNDATGPAEAPCQNPEPVTVSDDIKTESIENTSEVKPVEDHPSASAERALQEQATSTPEFSSAAPAAPNFPGQAPCSENAESPSTEKAPATKATAIRNGRTPGSAGVAVAV